MDVKNVKKTLLILYLFLLILISAGIWSISDMTIINKFYSMLDIIFILTLPIAYLISADSLEITKNKLIIGILTLIGFAFMTIIPIYIMNFFANIGIFDKYERSIVLFAIFWGINVYYGIKIIKIAFNKFKKTESIFATKKNKK